MRNKFICFALSAMLILTFIPQISFAVEEETGVSDDITVEYTEDSATESLEGGSLDAGGEAITETEEDADDAAAETAEESEEISVSGVITGFAPRETSDYYYEGNPEEEELTVSLPDTLSVYLDGSEEVTDIPVSWTAVEDFDDTDFYFYSMKPVWGEGISLSAELNEMADVPWITVYKQEPENSDIEPLMTEEELDPIYTEEDGSIDPDAEDASLSAMAVGTAGEIIDTVTEDSYAGTAANTAAIYNYLTGTMGLNKAAACGVMININAESGMSPNNLQNTYNTKFGLSDSAYTSAVDKGKGAYKTSSGKSQNFKTDSGGYGLCQWTSSGRKTNLLNRALSEKKSIGNITMQLGFLNTELQGYQQVLTTLRKVPNNAAGAYIAAAEFCLAFEIPANTVSTAASRGKNCLSNYWKTYSGSSASATGTSFLSLCGYSYPTAVKTGKGMDVTGYVVSNYTVKSLTGKIVNSSGKAVYSKTLSPGTTAYKLSNLDSTMKFSALSAGTYTYVITAKDSLGKTVTASHGFKVSSSGSTTKTLGFATTGSNASTSAATTPAQTTSTSQTTTVKKAYTGTFPKIPKRGYFKKGDKGTQVKNLQKFLRWYGYSISTDGRCGPKTISTIKKFQKAIGVKADGRFGKKTLEKAKTIKK